MYNCALCSVHACNSGNIEKVPSNCPSINEKMEEIKESYKEKENLKIAQESALVVSDGYCKKTRLEETMDFANRCGFKNIGLAFCIGLADESKMLSKVLSHNGFNVNSVICKNGSISRGVIDIEKSDVPMCNPIG